VEAAVDPRGAGTRAHLHAIDDVAVRAPGVQEGVGEERQPVERLLLADAPRQPEDIGLALNAIAASGIKTLFYTGDPIMRTRTTEIMTFLRDQRMVSIATIPTFAEAGGLAHYAPDGRGFYDRTASYVDRILKGARPADLPVEEPATLELVINLVTAKAIGLTVPRSLLQRADRVIE